MSKTIASDLEIRPGAAADREALERLLRRSWLTSIAPHLPASAVECFAATDPARAYVDAMWRDFTIAADGGEPVAMCHVQGDLVAAIHVDPDLKGQGIGSRLMAEAEERIATGYRQARLEVLAFNRAARQFYQSRGWVERRRFDGTESGAPVELVEMRLELRRSETRGRR